MSGAGPTAFDPGCRRCPRLAAFLDSSRERFPDYHSAPVAPFGERGAQLLIVGLAPGLHGANASGRPFTGDYAGILLYQTLHAFGFASAPQSHHRDDGLRLIDCRLTNAVKCVPPHNKPVGAEIDACNAYLAAELTEGARVILALGGIAHRAVLKALGLRQNAFRFAHNAAHRLPGSATLLDSYHCSRYNTQTRRLTEPMFHEVFAHARALLDEPATA